MEVEKLSQCFSLVTAPLPFQGTGHISGLQEQALRHFLSVYYFSFDSEIKFPGTAAAAQSQGKSVAGFEMKQTEQARLFIRSKQIIVEKVRAATAGDK